MYRYSVHPSVHLSVCLSRRLTHHDSPGGSMRRVQRTFQPDNKEERHTCCDSFLNDWSLEVNHIVPCCDELVCADGDCWQAATQFKLSLAQLMDILMSKQPSYVRCIKPNHDKKPGPSVCLSVCHWILFATTFRFHFLHFFAWVTPCQAWIGSHSHPSSIPFRPSPNVVSGTYAVPFLDKKLIATATDFHNWTDTITKWLLPISTNRGDQK